MRKELKNHVIIKLPEVVERTALSKASIHVFIKKGTFPKPIPLGARAVGWIEEEVNSWIRSRAEMRNQNKEILS